MKRTLVAATAVALLLGGCATGETGHLYPEISPDLAEPRSAPEQVLSSGTSDDDQDVDIVGPGTSAALGDDVEVAFAAAAGTEVWFVDVVAVDVDADGTTVVVSTRLLAGDTAAADACEVAFAAAQESGIAAPAVEVLDSGGQSIAERDAAAGDGACSGVPAASS